MTSRASWYNLRDQAEPSGMTRDSSLTALSIDSHLLEQRDCLFGIFGPTEKNRVLLVTEFRAASGNKHRPFEAAQTN